MPIIGLSPQILRAEVFKCQIGDKILYQSAPCPSQTSSQQVLAIEKTPADKMDEARQRLETWQADYQAREATKLAATRERQQQLLRQQEVEALQRSAKAQEDMAKAAQNPADYQPPVYIPYGPGHRRYRPPYQRPPVKPEPNHAPPSPSGHPDQQPFTPATPTKLR